MRDGGSKSKGSSFERKLAKELSLWLTNNAREDILWRSAMSGGRSTIGRAKGNILSAQAGDLSAIDPLGYSFVNRFYTEIKHYKKLSIDRVLTGTGDLLNFWSTAQKEAKFYKKLPFLVAKQNYLPTLICTSALGIHLLSARTSVGLIFPKYGMNILTIDEFFNGASPSRLTNYDYSKAESTFGAQKFMAQKRGIEFLFSFDEWVEWWEENLGYNWQSKRGPLRGQYVMARNSDKGPYSPENVQCKLAEDNISEQMINGAHVKKLTEEEVVKIYYDQGSLSEIAEAYDISIMVVSTIKRKRAWKYLVGDLPDLKPRTIKALTDEQIIEVFNSIGSINSIAKKYKVDRSTIKNIKTGKTWSHVTKLGNV